MIRRVGNIIIKYSNEEYNKMIEIADIIEKNKNIFDTVENNFVIDLSNKSNEFDLLYNYLVRVKYPFDELKSSTSNRDILLSTYLEIYTRKNNIIIPGITEKNANVSSETLFAILAFAYFEKTNNVDSFYEYIKHRYADNAILEWAKNELRDYIYQFVIEEIVNSLNTINENYVNQMEYVLTSMKLEHISDVNSLFNRFNEKIDYPKISEEEFDKMVYEFFDYIDAPIEWIYKYNYLKSKNYITAIESELDKSCCRYNEETCEYELIISNKNDINGFCSFVHEFVHYVITEKALVMKNIMVSEFPSIYFEYVVSDFLKEKGYESNIIGEIVKNRKMSNYGICIIMGEFFDDIVKYHKGQSITIESKIKQYDESKERFERVRLELIEKLEPDKQELLKDLDIFNGDYVKDIKERVDNSINTYLIKGFAIIQGYQYLIDTYLANKIRLNIDEKEAIKKMINITNNLVNYDIDDIINEFNLTDPFGPSLKLTK